MRTDEAANPVKDVIRELGGPTAAIQKTGISDSTWARMKRLRRVPDSQLCFYLAEQTGIDARVLSGYSGAVPTLRRRGRRQNSVYLKRRRRVARPAKSRKTRAAA